MGTGNISKDFRLAIDGDIKNYFAKDKKLRTRIQVKVNRLSHFISTGVWVDKKALKKWTKQYSQKQHLVSDFLDQNSSIYRKVRSIENGIFIESPTRIQRLSDSFKFLGRFIVSPKVVGSLSPSSEALAKAIVSEIPYGTDTSKRLILEVGPGTGAFSDEILKKLGPHDELHLVEFDATFAQGLKEKYKNIPQIKVIQGDITAHKSEAPYDFIVSGLPLNAFQAGFVDSVFAKFDELLKPEGKLSYFEYILIPKVKLLVTPKKDKANLQEILKKKQSFYDKHKLRTESVWGNITPARVLHHQKKSEQVKGEGELGSEKKL